jgi:rod shape-determining protein MreD
MNEPLRFETLANMGLWLLIAAVLTLARLLPLSVPGAGLPGPEILVALTLAWVLRRPAHVPALAVVAVFLAEDLLLMRPPGLWALAMLAGTEFLRRRQSVVREMNLLLEWAMVAATLVAMTIAYRLALILVMAPRPPLDLSVVKLVFTVLIYPVVVMLLQTVLRVRKPATGEVDERGRKL